ncbi:MAG: hypothetical protein PH343_03315, partial [Nitrospira sp.]|nr:hypothetical protein [Nitrospira sp.]
DYNYPVDPAVQKPNPDSNAYDKVPTYEVEVSHWISRSIRGTLAYESFNPNFFYDKGSTVTNRKISAEIYYQPPADIFSGKVIYSNLRDPDSSTTEIKGRDNYHTAAGIAGRTEVHYKISSLFGGAVELAANKWSGEVKYLPNRDLDNSYQYSVLTNLSYEFSHNLTLRLDYVYDKYSSRSSYAGKSASINMLGVTRKLNERLNLGVGIKHITLPDKNDNTGFLSISYNT